MTDEERKALNEKYSSRNILVELDFESNYHKATMSKNEAEFIRWLCGRAYEMLKMKEPIAPQIGWQKKGFSEDDWSNWYKCGECGEPIDKGDKFCRECGRAVKWDD